MVLECCHVCGLHTWVVPLWGGLGAGAGDGGCFNCVALCAGVLLLDFVEAGFGCCIVVRPMLGGVLMMDYHFCSINFMDVCSGSATFGLKSFDH